VISPEPATFVAAGAGLLGFAVLGIVEAEPATILEAVKSGGVGVILFCVLLWNWMDKRELEKRWHEMIKNQTGTQEDQETQRLLTRALKKYLAAPENRDG